MNESQLESKFRDWWKQSFPNSPPGKHAIASHVGFGLYLLQEIGHEKQQEEQER
jgi:hypothetical protein